MSGQAKQLEGKRIGIFGKGGAGKSTLIVLLSRALRRHGYQVCVLDANSTNFGLSQVLGLDHPPTPLLNHFGGMVFSGGLVTCPVDDPTPLPEATIDLEDLPAEYQQQNSEGITLLTAGKIGDQGPGAGCDGPIAKIARDLKIKGKEQQPVTVIDFKAGFEDSARGAITSLDWAMVAVDPTTASIEIAANMKHMVEQIKADVLPATAHLETEELVFWANKLFTESSIQDVLFVLNKVHSEEEEEYLRGKLAEQGIKPFGVIYQDDCISSAWLKGCPISDTQEMKEVDTIVERLESSAADESPAE